MNRYEKYRPSGIDWIGEIPKHWEIKKLKYLSNITMGKMLTSEDKGGYSLKPYLRAANLNWLSINISGLKEMWFSQAELEKLLLKKHDLVVSEGGEVGRTAIWQNELKECYLQNSVHRVRFYNGSLPQFFLYYFFYLGSLGFFESIVNRISIGHLTGEKLKEVFLHVPPFEEQTAIADYLDEKTAQIDKLIAKKYKLIELLKEERTAIINEAVSGKGKNWESKKLKYLAEIRDEEIEQADFVIAVENIESGTGRLVAMHEDKNYEGKLSVFIKGDTIFNKLRPYLHKVHLAEKDGGLFGELLILFSKGELTPEFLFYKLFAKSFVDIVDSSTQGTKMPRASWDDFISQLLISFPKSKNEQISIVQHIQAETQCIDNTISKIEKEIDLMQEYRTALISEVVTGKVKVI